MHIREATAADVAAVARLHYESWVRTYTPIVPSAVSVQFSLSEREAAWAEVFAGGHGLVFAAEGDTGEIIGMASGGPWRGEEDAGDTGELYVLHVAAAGQRRGTGRALVRAVATRLARDGMTRMYVTVLAHNAGARRFYEATGARLVREELYPFYGVPIPDALYLYPDVTTLM